MGHKPLQGCRYRTNNCTCTHPEMGVVKLLWWNLGNRQCFLVNQSKALTCSAAEPIPNKPLPPPAPPKKRTDGNPDLTMPVVNIPEMPSVKPPKTDGNAVTQAERLKESDIFRIKMPEEVLSSTVIQSPAITPITADPDVIKPNGSYSCNNKPCGLGKSHDAFYGCTTCGIRIFVKNTHSGGSM